ncbi:hypothetical protein [Fibrobacter sp.]|uniref:type IV toxin-antitoxin system AbiEi family antitoxin domain-containing protein n=1 Tax=Fibrobacter sp. TaxID=35828 RepID=UPI00386C45D6
MGSLSSVSCRNNVYFYYNSVKINILQNLGNKMILTFAQCIEKLGSKYLIKKAIADGRLFRVAKGFYSQSEHVSDVSLIVAKYPKAVFSMNTAFYHYGLTDSIPEKYYLATERGAKCSDEHVVLKFENSDVLYLGAVQEKINGTTVTMYNRERMLLELIRNKFSMPYDYYKEIILNYRKIINELNMQLVQDYLQQIPKAEMVRKVLEAEVL